MPRKSTPTAPRVVTREEDVATRIIRYRYAIASARDGIKDTMTEIARRFREQAVDVERAIEWGESEYMDWTDRARETTHAVAWFTPNVPTSTLERYAIDYRAAKVGLEEAEAHWATLPETEEKMHWAVRLDEDQAYRTAKAKAQEVNDAG